MKYYAIITFDHDQKQKVHYYTKGPLNSEEINQYLGVFSFLINRDAGTDYIYFKGLYDHIVYRVFIDDIISIEIKEEEDNG